MKVFRVLTLKQNCRTAECSRTQLKTQLSYLNVPKGKGHSVDENVPSGVKHSRPEGITALVRFREVHESSEGVRMKS
jgi:hypothetical protein